MTIVIELYAWSNRNKLIWSAIFYNSFNELWLTTTTTSTSNSTTTTTRNLIIIIDIIIIIIIIIIVVVVIVNAIFVFVFLLLLLLVFVLYLYFNLSFARKLVLHNSPQGPLILNKYPITSDPKPTSKYTVMCMFSPQLFNCSIFSSLPDIMMQALLSLTNKR